MSLTEWLWIRLYPDKILPMDLTTSTRPFISIRLYPVLSFSRVIGPETGPVWNWVSRHWLGMGVTYYCWTRPLPVRCWTWTRSLQSVWSRLWTSFIDTKTLQRSVFRTSGTSSSRWRGPEVSVLVPGVVPRLLGTDQRSEPMVRRSQRLIQVVHWVSWPVWQNCLSS